MRLFVLGGCAAFLSGSGSLVMFALISAGAHRIEATSEGSLAAGAVQPCRSAQALADLSSLLCHVRHR